jgi:para-aminobenzoate synthetase component 1
VPVRDADGDPRALRRLYEEAGRRAEAMEREWRAWSGIGRDPDAVRQDEAMRRLMEEDALQIDVERVPGLTVSMDKARFGEAVRAVQRYIAQGDVFQVNLSLRQSRSSGLSPEELYEWLRRVNPSPYMGLLRAPDFALVSASPEQLVKLKDGRLSTRPIAGTRRRGRTPEEDLRMERELRTSEKERAEHTMLVDLERNDLGRVSAYGTVQVPEWMTVERYSHVMHLVSQVEGRLAEGKDAFDVLAAVFPGGTITGAPKVRTMEIIEELEPVRRGPYTGSMGWIDYAGDMEFNIIIRTIAAMDGMCHIQAGAGIVIDSDPEREFYECLNKAKALWKAVQYGERLRARES